jgi:hypothetical protein
MTTAGAVSTRLDTLIAPVAPAPVAPAPAPVAVSVQDTAGKVAFVPKQGGPPDTSRYMWGGYAVAAIVYVGYVLLLRRRIANTRRGS